jgi:hypothetical protein
LGVFIYFLPEGIRKARLRPRKELL